MTDASPRSGRAEACANIALAKYWGKSPKGDNLPATPSLSLTLDALRTRTEVVFDDHLENDQVELDGSLVQGRPAERVSKTLDRFRALAGTAARARVTTFNDFPTAAGLASSASGFAALAVAADRALGLGLSAGQLSAQARKSSASAARSLFGGFAELPAEADEASVVAPENHWDVAMLVAVVEAGPKPISSTGGMLHTEKTSPYYASWVDDAPSVFDQVKQGVLDKDFATVANAMEHSTRLMHATMLTSQPPVIYLRGATIELMHEIARRRAEGELVAYTMDAGPNVKVLTTGPQIEHTASFLKATPGVREVIVCRPGPPAAILNPGGDLRAAPRIEEIE